MGWDGIVAWDLFLFSGLSLFVFLKGIFVHIALDIYSAGSM